MKTDDVQVPITKATHLYQLRDEAGQLLASSDDLAWICGQAARAGQPLRLYYRGEGEFSYMRRKGGERRGAGRRLESRRRKATPTKVPETGCRRRRLRRTHARRNGQKARRNAQAPERRANERRYIATGRKAGETTIRATERRLVAELEQFSAARETAISSYRARVEAKYGQAS